MKERRLALRLGALGLGQVAAIALVVAALATWTRPPRHPHDLHPLLGDAAAQQQPGYVVELTERSPHPVISGANPKGQGITKRF